MIKKLEINHRIQETEVLKGSDSTKIPKQDLEARTR